MVPALSVALYDKRLSPWDFQLLFHLVICELDPLNFRELKLSAVAAALGRDLPSTSRSIHQLTDSGYLQCEPRPHPGAMAKYRLLYSVSPLVRGPQSPKFPVAPPPPQRAGRPPQKVYVVRERGTERIKIGVSRQPSDRLKNLGSEAGIELELVAIIPGGIRQERALHKRFAACRTRGEWFQADGALRAWMAEIEVSPLNEHIAQPQVPKAS